jgi:hypothetical protein
LRHLHDLDTNERTFDYWPIIGVARLLVDNARGDGRTRICVPVTAGQLFQYNYDALYGEGGVWLTDANQTTYHDYDFEIIGEMLKDGVVSQNQSI